VLFEDVPLESGRLITTTLTSSLAGSLLCNPFAFSQVLVGEQISQDIFSQKNKN